MIGKIISSAILPVELLNKNDGQGRQWYSSANARKKIEALLLPWHQKKPFVDPVAIVITRVIGPGQRKYDEDSIGRGNAKQILDSLVALGWFVDDGPKWIKNCDYRQVDDRRDEGPATIIDVYEWIAK